MYKEIIKNMKSEMDKAILFLENELTGIQAGKASTGLVENMTIELNGDKFKLKELASINCPELRKINIQPWDASYLTAIQKGILKSPLEMSCAIDGLLLKVTLPSLTEENRKKITKLLGKKQEGTRVVVKSLREKAWSRIQKEQKEGNISENDKFLAKKELQKVTDEYNKKIKKMIEIKREEVMTI
jgi:ribosome recycling factor